MITLRLEFKKPGIPEKVLGDKVNAPRARKSRGFFGFADRHYVPYTGIMSRKYARMCILENKAGGRLGT